MYLYNSKTSPLKEFQGVRPGNTLDKTPLIITKKTLSLLRMAPGGIGFVKLRSICQMLRKMRLMDSFLRGLKALWA